MQCSLHGALVVQALLGYDDTKVITNSILSIPTDQLLLVSCDPCGNHIIDAFLSSKNVLLKKKTKLIKKFTVRLQSKHYSNVSKLLSYAGIYGYIL